MPRSSERLLNGICTHNGPLTPEDRERLHRALLKPSAETWNDVYSLIVTSRHSLWQMVKMLDPHCPAMVPFFPDPVRKWNGYFPDTFTLRRALIVAAGQDTDASSHG